MQAHFPSIFTNLSTISSLLANLAVSLLINIEVSQWSILYDTVISSCICSYSYGLNWYMFLDLSALTQTFLDFLIPSMSPLILGWNPFLIFLKLIFCIRPNRSSLNGSSLRLLGGVLCEFNLTILSVRDRMNSCFPGNGIFLKSILAWLCPFPWIPGIFMIVSAEIPHGVLN